MRKLQPKAGRLVSARVPGTADNSNTIVVGRIIEVGEERVTIVVVSHDHANTSTINENNDTEIKCSSWGWIRTDDDSLVRQTAMYDLHVDRIIGVYSDAPERRYGA